MGAYIYIMHKNRGDNCAKKRNVEGMLTLVYKHVIVQVWKSFAVNRVSVGAKCFCLQHHYYFRDKGEMCHEVIISLVWRGR